jgi:hypothetical protein
MELQRPSILDSEVRFVFICVVLIEEMSEI